MLKIDVNVQKPENILIYGSFSKLLLNHNHSPISPYPTTSITDERLCLYYYSFFISVVSNWKCWYEGRKEKTRVESSLWIKVHHARYSLHFQSTNPFNKSLLFTFSSTTIFIYIHSIDISIYIYIWKNSTTKVRVDCF